MSTFRETARVFIDRNLTPEARAARLAAAAREVRQNLVSAGRASPAYETVVDGRLGASEDDVRPEGRITYLFSTLGQATLFAIGYLRARSPSRTGKFRAGWVAAVDGRQIPFDQVRPELIRAEAQVYVFNIEGQARKIDVGFVGRRALKFSVPPGAIDEAVAAVRSRFGKALAASRVSSVTFPGQWTIKTGRRAGETVQTPALSITSR